MSWSTPTIPNGVITNYTLAMDSAVVFTTQHQRFFSIQGLTPLSTHVLSLRVCTNGGCTSSATVAGTVQEVVPSGMASPTVEFLGPYFATVLWEAPDVSGSATVAYEVLLKECTQLVAPPSGALTTTPICVGGTTGTNMSGSGTRRLVVRDLVPTTTYEIRVRVRNAVGSATSNVTRFTTGAQPTIIIDSCTVLGLPDAASKASVSCAWSAEHFLPVSSAPVALQFTLRWAMDDDVNSLSTSSTAATFGDLTWGGVYTLQVSAAYLSTTTTSAAVVVVLPNQSTTTKVTSTKMVAVTTSMKTTTGFAAGDLAAASVGASGSSQDTVIIAMVVVLLILVVLVLVCFTYGKRKPKTGLLTATNAFWLPEEDAVEHSPVRLSGDITNMAANTFEMTQMSRLISHSRFFSPTFAKDASEIAHEEVNIGYLDVESAPSALDDTLHGNLRDPQSIETNINSVLRASFARPVPMHALRGGAPNQFVASHVTPGIRVAEMPAVLHTRKPPTVVEPEPLEPWQQPYQGPPEYVEDPFDYIAFENDRYGQLCLLWVYAMCTFWEALGGFSKSALWFCVSHWAMYTYWISPVLYGWSDFLKVHFGSVFFYCAMCTF